MSEERDGQHWEAVEEATELLLLGQAVRAVEVLGEVLRADPTNPYAYHYLGAALFELQKLEPARDAYRAALKLSPDYLGAWVGLAHSLRMLGDRNGAVKAARQALKRSPGDADALHAIGLALAAGGERDEAIEMLERFLAAKPELEAQLDVGGMLDMLRQSEDGEPVDFE